MNKPTYYTAIRSLLPDAECGVTTKGDEITIHWYDSREQPSEDAIRAKFTEIQGDYDAKKYQRDRQYPPIGDQLDKIYHSGIDGWKKDIKDIKDAHPKPQ